MCSFIYYYAAVSVKLSVMPLFGQKRYPNVERNRYGVPNDYGVPSDLPTGNMASIVDTTTSNNDLVPEANNAMEKQSHGQQVIPSRKELLFHSQLAHGSSTKDVMDFSNVKELYCKITDIFSLGPNEVRVNPTK